MNVWDGIKLWIGKAIAEVLILVAFVVLILAIVVANEWWQERKSRKASS